MKLIAATLDPDGRRVALTEERWEHINTEHPNMAAHLRAVMAAVRDPTHRLSGSRPQQEWFYGRDAGPSAWIRVVVHYDGGRGVIVTTFPRRTFP